MVCRYVKSSLMYVSLAIKRFEMHEAPIVVRIFCLVLVFSARFIVVRYLKIILVLYTLMFGVFGPLFTLL